MKQFILYIGICLSVLCATDAMFTTIQAQTDAEKSVNRQRNRNFSRKSYNPARNLSKGGHINYPRGIDNDKSINFGFNLGGCVGTIDALKEEMCSIGGGFDFYMHKILKETNTIALGGELKAFYLMSDNEKYLDYIRPKSTDSSETATATTANWIAGAIQFSLLANFNATARCNVQLKANAGPCVVMVPENKVVLQVMKQQLDNSVAPTTFEYKYKSGMSIGASATLGADLLYALSAHSEIKCGIDWTYLRFTYEKEYLRPKTKIIKEFKQFGIYNFHMGFAFSF